MKTAFLLFFLLRYFSNSIALFPLYFAYQTGLQDLPDKIKRIFAIRFATCLIRVKADIRNPLRYLLITE